MKTKITTALLASTLMGFAQVSVEKPLESFSSIKIPGVFDVRYRQSDTSSVTISAQNQSDVDAVRAEVTNGVLIIDKKAKVSGKTDPTIIVKGNKLELLHVMGTGDFMGENKIKANEIKISSMGTGDVSLDLEANNITTELVGSGDIKLSGKSNSLSGALAGSGDLRAYDLITDSVNIKISGSGDVRVYANKTIIGLLSGSGDIVYKGNPVNKNIEVSGSGAVREYAKSKSDTTRFNLGESEVIILHDEKADDTKDKNKKHKKNSLDNDDFNHWAGIDIGSNGYLNSSNGTAVPSAYNFLDLDYAKSIYVSLNLFEKDFHIYKNYLNLVTGLGVEFNNYALKRNVTISNNNDFTTAYTDTVRTFTKNKLKAAYLTLPVLFEINTSKNPNKAFHIAVGGVIGYRIASKQKQIYEVDNNNVKIKTKDDFNLNPFRLYATARVGFDQYTLFANYAVNEMFETGKGPTLYPFSLGLNISF